MAYEPTVWNCGDVVTAEKLNKLENAVEELSESSGGGTAEFEYVKVMSTTFNFVEGGYGMGSGGQLVDGKTLGELVGDKTIIGFATSDIDIMSVELHISASTPYKSVLLNQAEAKTQYAFGVQVLQISPIARTVSVDIYAICI